MPNPWSKEEQERIDGIGASAMTVREQEHRESVHDDIDTNTGEAPQESGMGAEAAKQREDEMLADAHKAIPAESPSTVYSEGVDPAEAQRQFNEKLQNGYFSAIANREIPGTGDVDMDAFSVRAMRVAAAENGMELPPDEELMPPKKEDEPVDPAEEGDAISQEEAEQSVEVAKTSVDVIRDSAEQIMDIVKELGDSVEELSDAPTEENLEMAEEMDAGMLPGEDTQADEQRPAAAAASKEGSIADSSTPKAEGEDEEALKDGTKGRADEGGKLVKKKLTDKAGKVKAADDEQEGDGIDHEALNAAIEKMQKNLDAWAKKDSQGVIKTYYNEMMKWAKENPGKSIEYWDDEGGGVLFDRLGNEEQIVQEWGDGTIDNENEFYSELVGDIELEIGNKLPEGYFTTWFDGAAYIAITPTKVYELVEGRPYNPDQTTIEDMAPKAVKALRSYARLHRRIDDADFAKVCAGLGVKVEAGKKVLSWSPDKSDVTPGAKKIVDAFNALAKEKGWKSGGDFEQHLDEISSAMKPFVANLTVEDVNVLDDYNMHSAIEGLCLAMGATKDGVFEVGDKVKFTPNIDEFGKTGEVVLREERTEDNTSFGPGEGKYKYEVKVDDGKQITVRYPISMVKVGSGTPAKVDTDPTTASLRKDYTALTAQKMPHAEAIRVVASLYKVDAAKAERVVKAEDPRYKSDEAIADEFKGMTADPIHFEKARDGDSYIWSMTFRFPEGGESVGGGAEHTTEYGRLWLEEINKIRDTGNAPDIGLRNWYPDALYTEIQNRIAKELVAKVKKIGAIAYYQNGMIMQSRPSTKTKSGVDPYEVSLYLTSGKPQHETIRSDANMEVFVDGANVTIFKIGENYMAANKMPNPEEGKLEYQIFEVTPMNAKKYKAEIEAKGKKDDDDKPQGGNGGGERNRPFAHSRVAERRASAGLMDGKQVKWDIYYAGKKKKSMLFPPSFDKRQVVDTLVEKYGYHPDTTVKKAEDQTVRSHRSATAVSKGEIEDMIRRFNEAGSNFRLGETYGQYDLWATDKEGKEHRLESGSANDIKQALIKYRFNEKYQKATAGEHDEVPAETEEFESASKVADTILDQLGGQKFLAMTGAQPIIGGKGKELTLKLPAFAKDGINTVTIGLNSEDLYDVVFSRYTNRPKATYTVVDEVKGVYAEDLQRIFTDHTGLETSLGTMRGQKVRAENTAALDELREIQNRFSKNPIKDMPTDTYKKMSGEIKKKSDRMRELMAVLYDETPLRQAATATADEYYRVKGIHKGFKESRLIGGSPSKDAASQIAKEAEESGATSVIIERMEGGKVVAVKAGDELEHPRFGKVRIDHIDDKTYSIPMAVFEVLDGNLKGEKIIRPAGEFSATASKKKPSGIDVRQSKGKWEVVDRNDNDKILGTHDTEEKAREQQKAIYASMNREAKAEKTATAAANPIDIGDGYYAHKIGYDRNGNWAVWVSKGANPALKIRTNGEAPEAHRARGKYRDLAEAVAALSDRARDELKDYHKRFGAKAVVKKEGGDARPPFPAR